MAVATASSGDILIRNPVIADGAAIWQLVVDAGTLDRNSSYLYLLLCRDFSQNCVVAERNGKLEGFATGYVPPLRPDVLFLWQVGVATSARGEGLARRMILHLLGEFAAGDGRYLETTVTADNAASRALFKGIARRLDTALDEQPLFTADLFPERGHEAEPMLRIGPFNSAAVTSASRDFSNNFS